MKAITISAIGAALALASLGTAGAQTSTVTTNPNGTVSGGTTMTDNRGRPCTVVQPNNQSAGNTGSLSSSVTAGPGGVHSSSSGGPSVTVRSGDGSSTSTATSSGTSGSTVVTGTGSGDCTVTVNPGQGNK